MSDDATVDDNDEARTEEIGERTSEILASEEAFSEHVDASPGQAYSTFRVMHLESVLYDLTDPSPLVNLMESESPYRYLAIPVAVPDAIALQNANSGVEGRRPSTSELMTEILTRLQAEVIAARIVRYDAGVYYAELDLMTPRGREVFDCRTSDALTLALRQRVPAPILCAEEVLSLYFG
ncbi:MAG: bifunctional nuclease family protein [Acidimicrobiales bacterium]